MKRLAMLLALMVFAVSAATPVRAQQPQQKPDSGIRIRLTGNLYVAPQIWPDIGAEDDPKVGMGIGAMLGMALVIDDTRFGIGPHFAYNLWTADYSRKPSSATKSVTFGMADAGFEAMLTSDNIAVILGMGTSTMDASMTLDDGTIYYYPGLDKEKFGYNTAGVGFTGKRFMLGIVFTSYKGGAKDASHMDIRLALSR